MHRDAGCSQRRRGKRSKSPHLSRAIRVLQPGENHLWAAIDPPSAPARPALNVHSDPMLCAPRQSKEKRRAYSGRRFNPDPSSVRLYNFLVECVTKTMPGNGFGVKPSERNENLLQVFTGDPNPVIRD